MCRVIIGCGTGRCGTVSLAKLLNNQPETKATHERLPRLPWRVDFHLLYTRISQFRQELRKVTRIADVAFYYLPYIPYLLREFPTLRVVALQRDREETVRSYSEKLGPRNHFLDHPEEFGYRPDPRWDPCYPKYPPVRRETALRIYWEEYYRVVFDYMNRWPENVCLFSIDHLNSREGQREILNFCGIPEDRHVYILPLRENVGPNGYKRINLERR